MFENTFEMKKKSHRKIVKNMPGREMMIGNRHKSSFWSEMLSSIDGNKKGL